MEGTAPPRAPLPLTLGGHTLGSRLIVGTGKYPTLELARAAIHASGSELVTLAMRRIPLSGPNADRLLAWLPEGIKLLPNTSGCYTVEEAVLTAELGREALQTDLVKVEVIGCPRTLLPDNEATLEVSRQLVERNFTVLPYTTDDPIMARKLEDAGCAAVMPLAAPIGTGLGILNPLQLELVLEAVDVPVIVDAGIGTASDAARAMELGAAGVLMNTAIAGATDPVGMAEAMRMAVEAGYRARQAGRMRARRTASASSPEDGLLGS